jgi:antitoxin ParD1/3/4
MPARRNRSIRTDSDEWLRDPVVHVGDEAGIMARNTSVTLGDHFEKFVDEQVDAGRYDSVSAVVREALGLLEEREARLEALRAALIEGVESGVAGPIDLDRFLQDMHAEWKG